MYNKHNIFCKKNQGGTFCMNKTFCGDGPTDKTNISKIKNQLGKNSETGRLVLKYLTLSLF